MLQFVSYLRRVTTWLILGYTASDFLISIHYYQSKIIFLKIIQDVITMSPTYLHKRGILTRGSSANTYLPLPKSIPGPLALAQGYLHPTLPPPRYSH